MEVGGPLYEIDTEAVATFEASASTTGDESNVEVPPSPSEKEEVAASSSSQPRRKSSIKFLGKEGWALLLSGQSAASSAGSVTAVSTSAASSSSSVTSVITNDPLVMNPMYGRPQFSEEEMEALIMGGATLAPEVLSLSSGAKFK